MSNKGSKMKKTDVWAYKVCSLCGLDGGGVLDNRLHIHVCAVCAPVWFDWTNRDKPLRGVLKKMRENWPEGRRAVRATGDMLASLLCGGLAGLPGWVDHPVVLICGADKGPPVLVSQPYQYDKKRLKEYEKALHLVSGDSTSLFVGEKRNSFYYPGQCYVISLTPGEHWYSTRSIWQMWHNLGLVDEPWETA